MTRKSVQLLVVLAIVMVFSITTHTVRLRLGESIYTKRGTYAYFVCVSSVIKAIPEIDIVGSADFYSSAGDGPKLPTDEVRYKTGAQTEVVMSRIAAHLKQIGYVEIGFGRFELHQSQVVVVVEPDGQGRSTVLVTETR